MTSFMDRYGARLIANGYPIIPDPARHQEARLPSRWRLARLSGLDPARRARHHRARAGAVARAGPTPASASSAAPSPPVDIDIADDAELAHRIEQLARERLGDTPALRIGRRAQAAAGLPHRGAVQGHQAASAGGALPRPAVRRLCDSSRHRPPVRVAGREAWPISILRSLPAIDEATGAGVSRRGHRAAAGAAQARMASSMRRSPRRPCPAGHAGGGARGARLHPERRSRLRQLGAHRHGAQGRHRRRPARTCSPPGRRSRPRTIPPSPPRPGPASSPSASAPARSITTPSSADGSPIRHWCSMARRRATPVHPAAGLLAKVQSDPDAPMPPRLSSCCRRSLRSIASMACSASWSSISSRPQYVPSHGSRWARRLRCWAR